MGPFLAGFADELLKVAGPWDPPDTAPPPVPRPGGVVRPPSTGTPGAPAPKPTNMMGARNELLGAIPTQRLESPAKTTPQTWRPSPGYRPSSAGDPTTPAKPQGGGRKRGGGGGTSDVPWETAPQRLQRLVKERQYNADLKAGKFAPSSKSTSSAKSYRTPAPTAYAAAPRPAPAPQPAPKRERQWTGRQQ